MNRLKEVKIFSTTKAKDRKGLGEEMAGDSSLRSCLSWYGSRKALEK